MKQFLFAFALCAIALSAHAQSGTITISQKFVGIVEGYDHNCQSRVWVDNELVGQSAEGPESKLMTYTVKVPVGVHTIKVINFAEYEGKWEEHTIENNYSIDAVFDDSHDLKATNKLFLLFDIDSQTYFSWKKMPKAPKKPKSKG
jgi:hypothetical protein